MQEGGCSSLNQRGLVGYAARPVLRPARLEVACSMHLHVLLVLSLALTPPAIRDEHFSHLDAAWLPWSVHVTEISYSCAELSRASLAARRLHLQCFKIPVTSYCTVHSSRVHRTAFGALERS